MSATMEYRKFCMTSSKCIERKQRLVYISDVETFPNKNWINPSCWLYWCYSCIVDNLVIAGNFVGWLVWIIRNALKTGSWCSRERNSICGKQPSALALGSILPMILYWLLLLSSSDCPRHPTQLYKPVSCHKSCVCVCVWGGLCVCLCLCMCLCKISYWFLFLGELWLPYQ